jgi:ribonuclease T2
MRTLLAVACSIWLLTLGSAGARSRRRAETPGSFSYYMLVLSYAPDFCDQPQGAKDPRECGPGRHVGFVVHGLWPQGNSSRGPEFCGSTSPVSQAIVQATLRYIPTESLIQHEWSAHGTCSGLSAADYFAALRKARDSIKIPPELDQPARTQQFSPAQIESKFAAANPALAAAAIHTSCYRDGELEEVRICLNKDLSARACGPSAGECSVSTVTLLPVR